MADWVITPNSICPAMKDGATIKAGMIWINQVIASGEEANVAIDGNDRAKISYKIVKPALQAHLEPILAARQQDRFGVFPNVNESRAEVGFLIELIVVQFDERPAQNKCHV
jgi:hypothetical protein